MTPQINKPTLGELFDLPEHVGANDFVLKLTEAIARPETTVKDYVVTDQLRRCFDDALALVKDAIGTHRSTGAYLHGSFGTGKSHFMAMLYLLLSGDTRARSLPDLAEVVAKHEWTAGKKFLLVPYHMIGAETVEEREPESTYARSDRTGYGPRGATTRSRPICCIVAGSPATARVNWVEPE